MEKLWFHNGKGGSLSRRIMSKVIQNWQGPFVHVELQWPGGLSFSSRGFEKDHRNGVSYKDIDYNKHQNRWVCVPIDIRINFARMAKILDARYDYLGAVGWKYRKQIKDRWFCSEAICYVLHLPTMYPTKLYKYLSKI